MMPAISANTRVCGLIGDPVEHSISPTMHNAAFKKLGLDYVYLPFKISANNLRGAIDGLKSMNFRGINVTIPHKISVIPFLDELDPTAHKIGAVNTIVNDNGYLKGYNTDAGGFMKSLAKRKVNPAGKKIVILGTGGVSRAISFALAEHETDLVIMSRGQSMEKAEKLATDISRCSNNKTTAMILNNFNLKTVLKSADILINATGVGMSPNTEQTPVMRDMIKPGTVVFDVVYNPLKTRLLEEAEIDGAIIIGGLDMLVWQGALAFELWTGVKAPLDTMMNTAMKSLSMTA